MRSIVPAIVPALVLAISACAATPPAPTARPSATASEPSGASSAAANVDLSSVPTACYGLGPQDCRRVVAETAGAVPAGTVVRYIQVGPFGCAAGEGCPEALAARPEGDVTLEAGDGALSFHLKSSGPAGPLTIERQDAFGILLAPSSAPPVVLGAQPLTLGHCGLWSGIDAGGSWWDPLGQVDLDHPDAINAAAGRLVVLDPDHATFTSDGGLTVQLLRRNGEKYLPMCD